MILSVSLWLRMLSIVALRHDVITTLVMALLLNESLTEISVGKVII